MTASEAQKRATIEHMKRKAAAGGKRFTTQFDPVTSRMLDELVAATGQPKTRLIAEAIALFHSARISG